MNKTDTEKGVVLDMSNLAAVQEGAVVSRTVLDRETGTVTVFAFDQGQGLSEHTAPYDALVYILEGTLSVRISGKPLRLDAGQEVIIPAG